MSITTLIRYGSFAAIGAGILRLISACIPYTAGSVALESLYLIIDIFILLALLGIYAYLHDRVGKIGFLSFLCALIGTAIIVGPDGKIGTMDMYVVGSLLLSIGLSGLAIVSWQDQQLPRPVSFLWLISTVVGIGGSAMNLPGSFVIAGATFGLGFVIVGAWMMNLRNQGA